MGLLSFFSQKPAAVVAPVRERFMTWEFNPMLGMSYADALEDCTTYADLNQVNLLWPPMTNAERQLHSMHDRRVSMLVSMQDYAETTAVEIATEQVDRIYGANHPEYTKHFRAALHRTIETEFDIRRAIDGAVAMQTLQMEREDEKHREMMNSLNDIKRDTAYGDAKSAIMRDPLLALVVAGVAASALNNR